MRTFAIFLIIHITVQLVQAQIQPLSIPIVTTRADSIRNNILDEYSKVMLADSAKTTVVINGISMDQVVYQADSIYYQVDSKTLTMSGHVSLKYQDIKLTAGKIDYFADNELMVAQVKPVLFEGTNRLDGDKMIYQLRKRQGKVEGGTSQYEKGFYGGDTIRKSDEKTLLISNGYYTTCESDEPHYLFRSYRMKVILKDKVIAEPVIFYLGKVPVFALPFYVFPIRTGRQSGLLMPKFGRNNQDGRYIEDFGYYWATNDYMDLTGRISIREYTGVKVGGDYRYVWRHHLSGNVTGNYEWRQKGENQSSTQWNLVGNHSQIIDDHTKLNANANFVSNKNYYKNTSDFEETRTLGKLESYLTLDRSLGQTRLKLESRYSHNLLNDSKMIILPGISINYGRSNLIPKKRGSILEKWSPTLSFNTNTSLTNKYNQSIFNYVPEGDTTQVSYKATLNELTLNQGFSLNFSLSPQLVYWLNTRITTSLRDDWYKTSAQAWDDTLFQVVDVNENSQNGHQLIPGAVSMTASSAIYGIFQPVFGRVKAVRHIIRPSVSVSYNPGFYYIDKNYGFNFDKIEQNLASKVSVSNIGMSHTFEAKIKGDEGKQDRNIELFNVDFNSAYLKRENEWRFDTIKANLRTRINFLSLTVTTSYDAYKREFGTGTLFTSANLILSEEKARNYYHKIRSIFVKDDSTSADINVDQLLSVGYADTTNFMSTVESDSLKANEDSLQVEQGNERGRVVTGTYKATGTKYRWTLNLNHTYNRTFELSGNSQSFAKQSNARIKANLTAKITKKWDVSYNTLYDLSDKKSVSQGLMIIRDLHCWEARFTWTSFSSGAWNYYFIVNVKQLPDVKIEHRESRRQ